MTAVILLTATSVLAQEALRDRNRDIDEAREIAKDLGDASLHKGPLYLLSRFDLSDIGYNQAFFVPTADQSSGFSFAVRAPHKLYFVPQKKVVLSAEVTPNYAVVSKSTGRNQLGYFLRTDVRLLLNHLYVDGYAGKFDDLTAQTGDINRLVTMRDNNVGVTSTLKYSSRTSMHASAEFRQISFPSSRLQPEGIPVQLLARDEHNYRLSLNHKTFPLTSVTLAAERSTYNFATATTSDSTRKYAGAGLAYDDGSTELSVEAGPGRLEFRDPAQKDYRGVLSKLAAAHRFSTTWAFTASGGRDISFSLAPHNPYFISDRIGSELTWNTTRRLAIHFLANYGRDRYDTPINGVLRRDTLEYAAIGWLYTVRHISGGFDVGYFQRKSNSSLADQDSGIRGTLRLSLKP